MCQVKGRTLEGNNTKIKLGRMRRDWRELQREGGKRSEESVQRTRKGSERDTHVEQKNAGEKRVGRRAGSAHTRPCQARMRILLIMQLEFFEVF